MKDGILYAGRLRRMYEGFLRASPKPQVPEPDDPLRRLGIAILGVECGEVKAERAVERLFSTMVDWNEVRVSNRHEIARALGNMIPDGVKRSQRLIDALQSVFQHENRLSLDRLKSIGRREARQYLEQLDGVDEFAVASVVLWSIGGHAIPVDDRLLQALRDADLTHPTADRGEVQAFLERHINVAESKEFTIVMRSFPKDKGTKTKRGKPPATIRTRKKAQ